MPKPARGSVRPELLAEHLDRAQSVANTGSWEWDIASGGLIWSPQIFRIFGLEPDAIRPTYEAFLDRVHPDDRALVEDAVGGALRGEADYAIDHRIVLPDAAVRTVHELAVVERDESGEAVRMIGAVTDVTEVRAAERFRRQSQDMIASLFRISPEAIIVTDQNGRIILFSSGAEAMFGYAAEEATGLEVEVLLPMGSRAAHRQHVASFAGRPTDGLRMHERAEIRGLRKNGEEFPAEASLAKLHTNAGSLFTAIVRDLSEVRASEQRLIEAREQAERANLAKSSFLANMSHEIRTPLNGVLGVASALARTRLTARQRQMVQLIETSGQALQALLGDILDLAKADAGRIRIRNEPFDLARMVQDTCALFRASAAGKGVGLTLHLDHCANAWFEGDDLRIRQVLSNLLSNAVKFTEAGEIRLAVENPTCGRDSCMVSFVVQDTGIGFDASLTEKLFDRFEQADGSVTRRYGGTGLGLAISKSLVDLMDGSIWANSVPGRGSTFSFQIPLRRASPPAGATLSQAVPPAPDSHRVLQVLVAEDHPINRLAVEMILESLPVRLTCVENGRDAVDAVRARRFDLIFMDMQMPVLDGLSAIREIRRLEAANSAVRTPICVLTANALSEHRDAALASGADDMMTKPINATKLIEYVTGHLQLRTAPVD